MENAQAFITVFPMAFWDFCNCFWAMYVVVYAVRTMVSLEKTNNRLVEIGKKWDCGVISILWIFLRIWGAFLLLGVGMIGSFYHATYELILLDTFINPGCSLKNLFISGAIWQSKRMIDIWAIHEKCLRENDTLRLCQENGINKEKAD